MGGSKFFRESIHPEVDMRVSLSWFVFSLLSTSQAVAATNMTCVGSATDLTGALASLSTSPNSDVDEIRIRTGTYMAPVGGWVGTATGNHDLIVRGGYIDANCLQQTKDASTTILDGGNADGVLRINASFAHVALIEVSGLTIRNGNSVAAFGAVAGGLKVSDPGPISNGSILIERNIFRSNVATSPDGSSSGGGLLAATDGPSLIVRNNLFVNNSAPAIAAAYVFSNNAIDVSNNTFTGNHATDTTQQQRVTMDFFSLTGLRLSNNIFWRNSIGPGAFDLNFNGQFRRASLTNNDIEASTGAASTATGTLSVDPGFVAGTDFRLAQVSPLINAGVNSPSGGLAAVDLDGAPRIAAGVVDIGAYESGDGIFTDGFEQP